MQLETRKLRRTVLQWAHTRRRHLLVTAALIGVVTMGAVAARRFLSDWPIHRFGVVEEGVLYRGGQPDEKGWEVLRRRYGIRTVIDLRESEPEASWAVVEREFCRKNGVRLVNMPVGQPGLSESDLRLFVTITTDPASRPVLVHCEVGSIRTGVVVAAFRITVQGWSYEKAMQEAMCYGFRPQTYPAFDAYLKKLSERPSRPVGTVGARKG